mmetsp:Transcript_29150/g.53196  ORF Transcript_29150/g.53196 Transcript_29150/m.53196 type:complete len:326 (-) Transcript_29150:85-1062(-)
MAEQRLANIVQAGPQACYGIHWEADKDGVLSCKAYYNPEWRQEFARKRGLQGLYTTQSSSMTFPKGEGLVGKVFEKQELKFVPSLQVLQEDEIRDAMFNGDPFLFKRTALAKEYGVVSALFIPTANAVLEVGTMKEVSSADKVLPEHIVKAIQTGADVPETKQEPIEEPKCAAWLKEVVEACPEACYGIEWTMTNGKLELKDHYNPWWRLHYAKQAGMKGLFTTASRDYNFEPGEGVVGAVFKAQRTAFLSDMQNFTPEAIMDTMFTGDVVMFKRMNIAREYDVHSAVFIPVADGVVEVGSMQELKNEAALLKEAAVEALKARTS